MLTPPELSWQAMVELVVPLAITVLVARRSQTLFAAQWKATGVLNARVEETFSGHALVKTFGHQAEV